MPGAIWQTENKTQITHVATLIKKWFNLLNQANRILVAMAVVRQ